jgi:predicted GNAT family N-acyltransferase
MTGVAIRLARDAADLNGVYAVRHEVFVVGQAVPLDIERDAEDATALHVLAEDHGQIVGAGRLVLDGEVGVLGRLSVLPAARGRGIGVALVEKIERLARDHGSRAVEMHAQVPVRSFYERLGYQAYGDEYDEAGIPHISMRKIV